LVVHTYAVHDDAGVGVRELRVSSGKENDMGKVRTGLAVSLDGFISGPNDGAEAPMGVGGERLLAWYGGGDTEYRLPGTDMVFRVSAQTAEFLRETRETTGALVFGRRTFDLTHGWGGKHPLDVPVFVVSSSVPSTFAVTRLLMPRPGGRR
jgi:dihydrofolate reductase